ARRREPADPPRGGAVAPRNDVARPPGGPVRGGRGGWDGTSVRPNDGRGRARASAASRTTAARFGPRSARFWYARSAMTRFSSRLAGAGARAALGLALVLALAPDLATAQSARAQHRVVVHRFAGPRGSAARASLVRSLEENGVVVLTDGEVRAA